MQYLRKTIVPLFVLILLVVGCAAPAATSPEAPAAEATAPAGDDAATEAAPEATEAPVEEAAPESDAGTEAQADLPVVGLMKLVSHPALDAEQEGVKEALAAAGYIDGETVRLIEANAEGDIATLTTIAQRFVDEGVALIVATSTPALQAAFNVTQDQQGPPIVFNAVTSPYAAGIAAAADDHPAWVIGIQALAPVEDALALIPAIIPGVKTVGYIYNPAEANSVVNTEIAQPEALNLGLTLEVTTISNSSEVQTAAEALVARGVEAFFVSTDSTVVAGLEALVKVANDNDIPLFANDPSSAERGAAVALGLDYHQDGLDTGALAVGILKGELDIAATPIERQRKGSLAVNLTAAGEQGLEIPQEYLDQADITFE
ncbi:MAG: ABC transporter substrate-binding protein [Caldilineaceae bacterium]|nr:ABC transporter substrate-binding protein [Caldilineaceae bacterium]